MCKLIVPVCAGMLIVAAAFPLASAQTPGEIVLYAGNGTEGYSGSGGPATSAEVYRPYGVALDKSGNLYIADQGADCIWKVTASTGIITTVAGQCGYIGFSGDGGPASASFLYGSTNIAFDGSGNMFIADTNNQRVRKVDAATGNITTVAGDGYAEESGNGGPATSAGVEFPQFIAVDPSGNIYISDSNANVIRKVTVSTGIITTVVGNGAQGYTGDGGPAIDAGLYSPFGLALDSSGDLYIIDQNGSVVRKVSASTGIITTVVGNGVAGYGGDGGPAKNAKLNGAQDLTVDRSGNLYIVDQNNYRVRRVAAATQVITTVAGNGVFNSSGTGGPAVAASLSLPFGIAVDSSDNFYVSEIATPEVRKVFAGGQEQSAVALNAPKSNFPVGQSFNITATVSGPINSPIPTGTVTFYLGTTEEDTVPLNSSGVATYSASLPAVNSYGYTASYSGDKNYAPSASTILWLNAATKVAPAPQFGPGSGTYTYNLQVSIFDSTPGLAFFYTTDGSTPSATNGTRYTGAITVTANTTIKAVARDMSGPPKYADSPVASASYVVNLSYEAPLPEGEWAWESGGPASTGAFGGCRYTDGNFGVYGTLGVPAANNVPGGRTPAAHWIDHSGNFWLFGGPTATGNPAIVDDSNCGDTNDLWMFNPGSKEWMWMSGSSVPATVSSGVYGVPGKFASGNVPGSRSSSVSWTDKAGNLWLFGGEGYDSTGKYGGLNDLWEFNPTIRQWAWMGGSNVVNERGSYGTLHGFQSANVPGSRWGAVGWTDLQGNFWMFGGFAYDSAGNAGDMNDLWEFNPSTRDWAWMGGSHLIGQPGVYGIHDVPSATNIPGARDSGVAWVDALGKFWFFGGEGLGATTARGLFNDLWEFNPSNLNWTWASGSAYGRTDNTGVPGQSGLYDKLGVPDPGNTPGSRWGSATFTDAQGNLWMFGGTGYDSAGNFGDLDDLWEFDRAKWLWAWMGGQEMVPDATYSSAYGPYRALSAQTQPGPRSGAAGWTDKSGNLWLFGGTHEPVAPSVSLFNDLFEYQVP